jgi:hypothetical protein
MTHWKLFALLICLVGIALLIGCKPPDPSANWAASTDCKACHSAESTSTYGPLVLANQAAYHESGHLNGPRTMIPSASIAYEFDGSDSMYCNGSSCSQCHTAQGFVSFVNTGVAGNQEPASPPGCFTCHKPHETGDFSLRTTTAVKLIDNVTTFDKGKGNLCVTCHHARTPAVTNPLGNSGISATDTTLVSGFAGLVSHGLYTITATTTAPKNFQRWSSSSGPHHGPQSDFMMGVNNWTYTKTAVTYQGPSAHYNPAADSCVACHMYDPATGNLSGTLSMGGHGWYLTDTVHGASTDLVGLCKNCHVSGGTGAPWPTAVTATTFDKSNHTIGDIDGDGATSDVIVEIDHMKKALLTYFGNSANFLNVSYTLDGAKNYTGYTFAAGSTAQAPVTSTDGTADYVPGATWDWHRDWEFNAAAITAVDTGVTNILAYPMLNKWQSQSFWNFKLFMEDKSRGVHNPRYAAQILYDAIMNLYDNGVPKSAYGMGAQASLSGLGTRP